jgi:hypothetical protein
MMNSKQFKAVLHILCTHSMYNALVTHKMTLIVMMYKMFQKFAHREPQRKRHEKSVHWGWGIH